MENVNEFAGDQMLNDPTSCLKYLHNMHKSREDFLNFIDFIHTKDSDEYQLADEYILSQEDLNTYLQKFWDGDVDRMFDSISEFIKNKYIEVEETLKNEWFNKNH